MATVRGYIINLPEARERRQRLQSQLHQLGISQHYQWFEAQRGASSPAKRRGLSPGEDGLWRSVLQLLHQAELGQADYLHILEDDAEVSGAFWQWLTGLSTKPSQEQLLFTDMYAGASVFPGLLSALQPIRANRQQAWLGGKAYTGCTTSWLIHRAHLPLVRQRLSEAYGAMAARIPIDNLLRRLIQSGQLSARVSLPFLTSIHLGDQRHSAIQQQEDHAIHHTRLLGALLRRRLSVLHTSTDLEMLGPLLASLLGPEGLDAWLAERLVPDLQQRKALRYRLDRRLLQEPGNPQTAG